MSCEFSSLLGLCLLIRQLSEGTPTSHPVLGGGRTGLLASAALLALYLIRAQALQDLAVAHSVVA